ncbi:Ferredoxin-1, partial [Zea mays]
WWISANGTEKSREWSGREKSNKHGNTWRQENGQENRDRARRTPPDPHRLLLLLLSSLSLGSQIKYALPSHPMAPLLSPPLLADTVTITGLAGAGRRDRGWRRRAWGRTNSRVKAVAAESRSSAGGIAEDYYAVLGVVLTDPIQRAVYDEIHGYAATATNPFLDDSAPRDHVFVDEFSCIGCKNCANVCSKVFQIEEDFGRARVYDQSGSTELIQEAIDSCPVDCIHWTSAAQLSLLEDEMRRVERVNVGLMLAGWEAQLMCFGCCCASSRWKKRQAKVLEKVRRRMSQDDSRKGGSWSDIWGAPTRYEKNEAEAKERAKRAAAAARRWREYSRKGTDKYPAFKLPEAVPSSKE